MKIFVEVLDPIVTDTAVCLAASVDVPTWTRAQLAATFVPNGETSSLKCTLTDADEKVIEGWYPLNDVLDHLYELTKRHWQSTQDLGQPRWYKMTVTVERSGKFSVDFEYKDDYQEGDIMKCG